MTLKQYRAFICAVEEGTIIKGALKAGATQSGFTHLIQSFEEELGFSVMTRTKRGITLTEEGRHIFPYVKEIVESDDKFLNLKENFKVKTGNRINIGTFSSVAVNWLPSIIHGFKKIEKDAEFIITDGGYGDILQALSKGSVDLGFISLPAPDNLKYYSLYRDRVLAVVPLDSPLAKLDKIPVSAFSTEPVISLAEDTDFDSRRVFENANIVPNIKYRTTDDYAMISMVENNLGICLEPEMILTNRRAKVKILETEPPSYRTIAIAIPYEKTANPLAIKFADFIVNWVKENIS